MVHINALLDQQYLLIPGALKSHMPLLFAVALMDILTEMLMYIWELPWKSILCLEQL